MNVLMCEPRYYGVYYEINPWMHRHRGVALEVAYRQWQALRSLIVRCGADVTLIDQDPGLPDMVFTANAGLVHGSKVWLSHFKFPERQKECEFFRAWFLRHGFAVVGEQAEDFDVQDAEGQAVRRYVGPAFEGAGDGLFLGDTLVAAYGFRSDKVYYERLVEKGIDKILRCELVDPYFYHLDTCFCPLDGNRAIWWPNAFSPDSQTSMRRIGELFAVPESEAKCFACNSVVVGTSVIMPSGCPETAALLASLGFTVHDCDMSEFIKAGGACKCLTLML